MCPLVCMYVAVGLDLVVITGVRMAAAVMVDWEN